MYNTDRKAVFLSTITSENSKIAYIRLFNSAKDIEAYCNKDICEMNSEELCELIGLVFGTKSSSLERTLSQVRSYIEWCVQHDYAITNTAMTLHTSDVDKNIGYQMKYLKDRKEFEDMLRIAYRENPDSNELDKQHELIVRLCYLGMDNEEIVRLKYANIDVENRIIKSPIYERMFYKVDEVILHLCTECNHMVSYVANSRWGIRTGELLDVDYILKKPISTMRGDKSEHYKAVQVNRYVKEFNDIYVAKSKVKKELTAAKLKESGLFHYIHENKAENRLNDWLLDNYKNQNPNISGKNLKERVRRLRENYYDWEKAFYGSGVYLKRFILKPDNEEGDIFEEIERVVQDNKGSENVTIDRKKRNRELVLKMKKAYGCCCQLCNKENNFDIIMDSGEKYIQVHHIKPLAESLDEDDTLDRPGNMIVVCPNHHMYLHYNQGGNYSLALENGQLVLRNENDLVPIVMDKHLKKYGFYN